MYICLFKATKLPSSFLESLPWRAITESNHLPLTVINATIKQEFASRVVVLDQASPHHHDKEAGLPEIDMWFPFDPIDLSMLGEQIQVLYQTWDQGPDVPSREDSPILDDCEDDALASFTLVAQQVEPITIQKTRYLLGALVSHGSHNSTTFMDSSTSYNWTSPTLKRMKNKQELTPPIHHHMGGSEESNASW